MSPSLIRTSIISVSICSERGAQVECVSPDDTRSKAGLSGIRTELGEQFFLEKVSVSELEGKWK